MTMFGIGPGELLLVLVIALVVVGPQRLPKMARQVGKAINDLKQFVRSIDPQLLADFREVTQEIDVVRAELTGLRAEMAGIQGELAGAARDVSRSVNEAVGDVNAALTAPDVAALAAAANASPAATAPAAVAPRVPAPATASRPAMAVPDEEIVGERIFPCPTPAADAAAEGEAAPLESEAARTAEDADGDADRLPELALSIGIGE